MDGVDQVVDRQFEFDRQHRFVNEVPSARRQDTDPEDAPGLRFGYHFDQAACVVDELCFWNGAQLKGPAGIVEAAEDIVGHDRSLLSCGRLVHRFASDIARRIDMRHRGSLGLIDDNGTPSVDVNSDPGQAQGGSIGSAPGGDK